MTSDQTFPPISKLQKILVKLSQLSSWTNSFDLEYTTSDGLKDDQGGQSLKYNVVLSGPSSSKERGRELLLTSIKQARRISSDWPSLLHKRSQIVLEILNIVGTGAKELMHGWSSISVGWCPLRFDV
jgi:hypothetical protein